MTYDELVEKVRENDGFLTLDMGVLRDTHGAGKLGVHVVAEISEQLQDRGLGHYPPELPQIQSEKVRVYRRTSRVGRVITAAISMDDRSDERLRELQSNEAADKIRQIRAIVDG